MLVRRVWLAFAIRAASSCEKGLKTRKAPTPTLHYATAHDPHVENSFESQKNFTVILNLLQNQSLALFGLNENEKNLEFNQNIQNDEV